MPERPADCADINPARLATDSLLAEIADLVGYMDLHIGRYEIKQLTTVQKELWADLVDANAVFTENRDESAPQPRRTVRWWRNTPARPIGEEGHRHDEEAVCRGCGKVVTWDADIEKFWIPYGTGNPPYGTFHCKGMSEPHWALPDGADEPDPFVYTDEGGSRLRGSDLPSNYDQAAARVARSALLDVMTEPTHPERAWFADDFAALYEWAKQAVKPMRRTTGERAGEIGALRAYPSLNDCRAFLARHRLDRRASLND